MLSRIITIVWFTFVVITSIIFFIIALLLRITTPLFDPKLKVLHIFTCFWASLYTWVMPGWRIRTYNRDKINRDSVYVVVSNHQSQLDILVAFRMFFHYKWVSKIEIFKVPLIGWNMVLNRYIKIKRGDKESVKQMMDDCERTIREGSSVYFFPEGTRSPDGVVKKFKTGAFELAKKMKVNILPLVITGTNKALPKYSIRYHGLSKMGIKVLDEIPYAKFADLSIEETAGMVRDYIVKNLAEFQEEIERS
jgi:1-acyl-sn-glycerol-3-phosphate acyltransferase